MRDWTRYATRFVERTTTTDEGCVRWVGPERDGLAYVATNGSYRLAAWRYAWWAEHGVRPPRVARTGRSCGHAWCLRPDHLLLYDDAPEVAVARPKTAEDGWRRARQIRAWHAAGVSQSVLARKYALSRAQIANIVHGRAWRDALSA